MYKFKPLEFNRHFTNSISHPEGRVSSTICSNGNNLYIFGGVGTITAHSRKFLNQIISFGMSFRYKDTWSYNLSSRKWRLLINEDKINLSKSPADGMIGVMFETNFLIICTFTVPFDDMPASFKSCLYLCDLKNKSVLVQNTNGEIPDYSSARNLIRHEKFLYTIKFVGFGANNFDVYRLNTETRIWKIVYECEEIERHVIRTSQFTLIYDGKAILVLGGYHIQDDLNAIFSLARIPVFDLKYFTWKIVDTYGDENHTVLFPEERFDYSTAQYKNPVTGDVNVIITGGIVEDSSGLNSILTDVWELNLTSFKWKYLGLAPSEIDRAPSTHVTSNGQLFTFGGFIRNSKMGSCTSAVYSTWLLIPKLEDICWQAVLHYHPNLASKTKEEVISLGISWEIFQSRIH